jgi:hypothetical protein
MKYMEGCMQVSCEMNLKAQKPKEVQKLKEKQEVHGDAGGD